jgi:cyanophycinase-like exopeptidase
MLGLAVEEATGLVVQGDRLEVVGCGNAHVFIKASGNSTIIWHSLRGATRAS